MVEKEISASYRAVCGYCICRMVARPGTTWTDECVNWKSKISAYSYWLLSY